MEEYRKNFGKKYSRSGANVQVERAKTSRDDLFNEKKHLKEQSKGK